MSLTAAATLADLVAPAFHRRASRLGGPLAPADMPIHQPEIELAAVQIHAVHRHPDPIAELERLHAVAAERFLAFRHAFPTAERPWGIWNRAEIETMIADGVGR